MTKEISYINDNKLKVEKTTRSYSHNDSEMQAKFFLEQAGSVMRPPMSKHFGSYACHMYLNETTNTVEFVIQKHLGNTDETLAKLAVLETNKSIMEEYGHKPVGKR